MDDRPPPPPDPKGKAAAVDASSGTDDPEPPSVLSRIARSAAGLGRDAVAGRPHRGDLAGLVSTDSKAGPSGLSTTGGPGPYAESHPGEGSRGTLSAAPATTTSAAFVTGHTRQHIAAQEDAFAQFLDGADIDTSLPGDFPGGPGSKAAFPLRTDTAAAGRPGTVTVTDANPVVSAAVAEQQSRDGLDVVHLLAGGHGHEEEPDYLQDVELAEDEAAGLQRALFGSSQPPAATTTGAHQQWDHVLNFVPAFVRPTASAGRESHGESYAVLGVGHTPEATRLWLDQWRDVLTRYDEEVWGGLAPLVAEARDEIEQLGEADGASHSTRALGRLQQILGHLRGSQ